MSEASEQSGGRRSIGRVLFLIFLCLFLMGGLSWLALDLMSKRGLAGVEQQEHFNFADVIPRAVPAESNFALVPVVASSYEGMLDENGHLIHPANESVVDRLDMAIFDASSQDKTPDGGNWALGQRTDLKAFQQYYATLTNGAFPVSDTPQSPAADVLLALSKYNGTIEELRQAAVLPDSRFPLNYDSQPPAEIVLPHLAGLKGCSQMLELRAVAELQEGQSDEALADVKLLLRMVASVRNEPFLISQFVRLSVLKFTLQPIWEGTQEHRWSDGQLKELDRDLAGLDLLADYEFSMRGDCALEIANMEYLRHTRNLAEFSGGNGMSAEEIGLRFAPDFVYYHNELVFAQAFQDWILPIADVGRRSVSPAAATAAGSNIERMHMSTTLNNVLANMLLPTYERCAERFSYSQSSVDMARVAAALERYRLAQGKYPDSLNALVPGCIKSVPSDIIGGKPLIYHRSADGRYVLYSIGWNGTDDGGTVFFKGTSTNSIDYEKGDWVWAGQIIGP